MKVLAKYHLEVEKPTKFFCWILKKRRKHAQFDSFMKSFTDEEGNMTEVVLEGQEDIEEEICRFYKLLYANSEVEHSNYKY